ncbi:hypothetical protein GX441_08080 [bacterium]|nr:hypothetical protein [bacterium]
MIDEKGKFVGEKIKVETMEDEPVPVSFIWAKKSFCVTEIIKSWQDHSFSEASPKRRTWLMRRHRNVFLVKTSSDEVFEIYLDRGAGRRDWYLYKKLK